MIQEKFKWDEIHHGYIGLWLMVVAPLLPSPWREIVFCIGLYALADDICRHTGGLHDLFVYLWGLTGWPWPGDNK